MGISKKLNSILDNLLIAVVLFFLTNRLSGDSTSINLTYLKVIKDSFIREGPASYYKVAENLATGTIIQAIEKHNDWYLVKTHSGQIGWISADDVTPQVKFPAQTAETKSQISSDQNLDQKLSFLFTEELDFFGSGFLWTEPGNSGKIVTYLTPGLQVKKLETNGIFFKVQLPNGLIGWVDQSHFSSTKQKLSYPTSEPVTIRLNLAKHGNLRQEPSLTDPVIEKIPGDKVVWIIDTTNVWHQIKTTNNQTGGLYQSSLNQKTVSPNGGKPSVKILQRNGNLRQSPSLTSEVIQVIPSQTAITVLDSLSDWYQVRLSDETVGWINKIIFEK